tara:strand:+ start:4090 stop:4422 length:333 start_codon:yes stop_codon:yes gene_type:complete
MEDEDVRSVLYQALGDAPPTPAELATLRRLRAGELVAVEGWQPIETAPKDGTVVLCCCAANYGPYTGHYECAAWVDTNEHDEFGDDARPCYPTHWAPLPAPPAEKETGHG